MLNQNLLLAGDDAYNLTRSLRFRSSASGYLNRTFSTPTNALKWTWSGWVKRGVLGNNGTLISGITSGSIYTELRFNSTDVLRFHQEDGATTVSGFNTTAVYRDPSAWYHVVCIYDSANATSANRLLIYVNGVLQSGSFDVSVPSNQASNINKASEATQIGNNTAGPIPFDGYLAEVNFIDGQALTPSSFGQTSTSTGVWIPKKYTGTYGANGFYLPFTDIATTSGSNAGLGKDFSGNGNYWTTNNISVTTGTTYDSMKDVPTLTDTDTANYCTYNPLALGSNLSATAGNLNIANTINETSHRTASTTFGITSGKWYWELNVNNSAYVDIVGVITTVSSLNTNIGSTAGSMGWGYNTSSGGSYAGSGWTASGSFPAFPSSGIIGIAFDATNGKIWFSSNGSWINGSPSSGTSPSATYSGSSVTWLPALSIYYNTGIWSFNAGQRPFAYTPPTGFKALNTYNLPTPTIGATASSQANRYMDILTWSGTGGSSGATRSITGLNFQPDFVWEKARSSGSGHQLLDSVRGVGQNKVLASNSTGTEPNPANTESLYGWLSSLDSGGFTVTNGTSTFDNWNKSGDTYVAWNWKANGSGSTNTAGSITSTVSANTTAGFSIVTYNGTGVANATVGHGLGVAPSMIIFRNRQSVFDWPVYHSAVGASNVLFLNTTAAASSSSIYINGVAPTSTVFTLGTSGSTNSGANQIAYCFAQVAGYSAFGSYTGNGSTDGPFVFTGFRPRYVMIKASSIAGENWYVVDATRSPYNAAILYLSPNNSGVEAAPGAAQFFDFLSNGFKLRVSGSYANSSGETYIYMAFAESPFKYSLAR